MSVISCATKLPSEKPRRSTRSNPIASTKASASCAIVSTVFGVVPAVAPTLTIAKVAVRILDPVLGSDSLRRRVGVAGQLVAGRVVRWSP
jgi:hypothetical protein